MEGSSMGVLQWFGDVVGWLGRSGPDIAVNLIAAGIGGVAVWATSRTRRRTRLVRARRFWKHMGDRGVTVVVGVQDRGSLDAWERSGLIGLGDAEAMVSIEEQLRDFGFDPTVRPAEDMASPELRGDLVLIGGPDANAVTAEMMRRIGPALTFGFPHWRAHVVLLTDTETGAEYNAEYDREGRVVTDYGLVVRAPNPLAEDGTEVVILAGCWGHGTAAAAESLRGKALHRHGVSTRGAFEALVKVAVVNGRNHAVSVVDVRALREGEVRAVNSHEPPYPGPPNDWSDYVGELASLRDRTMKVADRAVKQAGRALHRGDEAQARKIVTAARGRLDELRDEFDEIIHRTRQVRMTRSLGMYTMMQPLIDARDAAAAALDDQRLDMAWLTANESKE